MIRESDVLQAIGYAVIFRGRWYGGAHYTGHGTRWKAFIRARWTTGSVPEGWYFYADSIEDALRLAFDDFRECAAEDKNITQEYIDAFERELFGSVSAPLFDR